MKYREAKEYRAAIEQRGMVLGLDNMTRLMEVLGNPQDKLRYVHVAGTNGKGSVVTCLSRILTDAGYRTGAYTSPAVFHPLEIYQIDGRRMSESYYGELMDSVREASEYLKTEKIYPTPFEIDTAIAFLYFMKEKCDIVCLETGLGGALDATNCIKTVECAVLTSISMDHMKMLGTTVEEIAGQKAGIIKEGCMAVSGIQRTDVLDVLEQVCKEKHARLAVVDEQRLHTRITDTGEGALCYPVRYKEFPEITPGIIGQYQTENAAIVLEVVEKLCQKGYNIPETCIRNGIEGASWHGRMTVASTQPLIVMDGAHNVQAVEALAQELKNSWRNRKWIFIIGVLADKDYRNMFLPVLPFAERILTITPPGSRALAKEELAGVLNKCGGNATPSESLQQAVSEAVGWCEDRDDRGILVFGSFTFLRDAEQAVRNYMPLVERLVRHPLFREKMTRIEELERDRDFCCHGWEHCLAVARAAALLNEEQQLGYPKQMLYALALIHDLGRAEQYINGTPHEEAGVRIARRLLEESGFDSQQIKQMLPAVRHHRNDGQEMDELTGLLVQADKQTRLCFACSARESCKWPDWKKNLTIHI